MNAIAIILTSVAVFSTVLSLRITDQNVKKLEGRVLELETQNENFKTWIELYSKEHK